MASVKGGPECRIVEKDPKNPEYLAALRHSCAHLMAQAVQDLFPGTKIAIGPSIDNGFYYDFDSEHRFTDEDLRKIEKRMVKVVDGAHGFQGEVLDPEKSRAYWDQRGEIYKVELLDGIVERGETVTHYTHDTFTDLCRGGHVENTKELRHFRLTHVSGAYWRGDEKRKMLQRIYGTAWASKEDLKDYLRRLEEAKRRDHRKIGKELGLFTISETIGPGLPVWLPKGAAVREVLQRYITDLEREAGYHHVYTPQLARTELYKQSGHWDHFKDDMYPALEFEDKETLVLRPMNCPHHVQVYKHELRSYRDLPLRLAELGTMYRYERSGVLSGLSRVRAMTLNDAHIFCLPEQIREETVKVLRMIRRVYDDFGLEDYWYRLSLGDPSNKESFVDAPELWAKAERLLVEALEELELDYVRAEGEAAYYGPKIDVQLNDVLGRSETVSTVQLDFYLPERFELEYVDAAGGRSRPVMVHRGVLSTMERMMAFLIEHYVGKFPFWLAPVQAKILTVVSEADAWAREIEQTLRRQGFRVETDLSAEKIGKKVRLGTLEKVPYLIVVGAKEAQARNASLRLRSGKNLAGLSVENLVEGFERERSERSKESAWA